ncbi:MAG: Ig-like domain-containing protein, partial [Erysipelotrichaceae bacterium]|nr:Ig-like domain-containing protein [Erysipelotrichaceae bacterium]
MGWDDSFSRTNFKEGRQPSTDGAWLIRNSWGSFSRNNGYFWISYEDVSLNEKATAYEIVSAVENENIYQYDGGLMDAYYTYTGSVTTANVYTTARSEQLKEVGFFSRSANYSYSISVYAGISEDQPTSGTLYATAGGDCDYAGYYTVPLTYTTDTKWMEEGTRFSIVLTFTAPSGVGIQPVFDHAYTYPGWFDSQPTTNQHQSFLWTGSKWDDRYTKNETYRIKGMAVPAKLISTIELGSNLYLVIGDTRTLPLTVTPSGALDTYSLSSSNPLVATVTNDGVVTAVGEGVCEITAIADGGYTNSITVTVTETPVGVREFTVSPESVTMVLGGTQLLTVTPDPLDAQDTFEFQSSDPSVATVSSTGLVSAVGVGNATITVHSVIGNATRTCSVTVRNIALTDFTVSPQSMTFHPGDTQQLTVTKNPANAPETFAYQS